MTTALPVPRFSPGHWPVLIHQEVHYDQASPSRVTSPKPFSALSLLSPFLCIPQAARVAQNSAGRLVWDKNWQLGSWHSF